jgi:hypothetical protein
MCDRSIALDMTHGDYCSIACANERRENLGLA